MNRTKTSVKVFADSRGLEPQSVYYYIRTGKLTLEECECCGHKVIDIKLATEFFDAKQEEERRNGIRNNGSSTVVGPPMRR